MECAFFSATITVHQIATRCQLIFAGCSSAPCKLFLRSVATLFAAWKRSRTRYSGSKKKCCECFEWMMKARKWREDARRRTVCLDLWLLNPPPPPPPPEARSWETMDYTFLQSTKSPRNAAQSCRAPSFSGFISPQMRLDQDREVEISL